MWITRWELLIAAWLAAWFSCICLHKGSSNFSPGEQTDDWLSPRNRGEMLNMHVSVTKHSCKGQDGKRSWKPIMLDAKCSFQLHSRGAQTLLWKQLAHVPVLSRLSLQPAPSVIIDWAPVNQVQCSCSLPSLWVNLLVPSRSADGAAAVEMSACACKEDLFWLCKKDNGLSNLWNIWGSVLLAHFVCTAMMMFLEMKTVLLCSELRYTLMRSAVKLYVAPPGAVRDATS